MNDESRASVAIRRTHEKHRSAERVFDVTRETVALLGGIERFVQPGQSF